MALAVISSVASLASSIDILCDLKHATSWV